MTTNTPDEAVDTGISDDDAVAALMKTIRPSKGDKAPAASDQDDEDDDEDEDEDDGDEASVHDEDGEEADDGEDEDGDEDDGDDEGDDADGNGDGKTEGLLEVKDDAKVKVTVDGQEQEFTIGSLKRLAGQEASLTRKSQEADIVGGRAAVALQGAIGLVMEDLEPYKNVDWTLLGHQMDPEEFAWHRENFTRNTARYNQLIGAAQNFEKTIEGHKATQRLEQATEAVKELSDPQRGIPGWNEQVYGEVMNYAVSQGLPEEDVANIANAKIIKLLHKAMQYDKGAKAVAEKVKAAPKNVRRGPGRETVTEGSERKQSVLEKRLKSGTASEDDAIALLTGRWRR